MTHNVGGQTHQTPSGLSFLSEYRGYFGDYGEQLSTYYIEPQSINEDVDGSFQEYVGMFIPVGPRKTNLYIADKNYGTFSKHLIQERILIYPSPYIANGEQIFIVNFHGKIISDTSSKGQIDKAISLIRQLKLLYETYNNLIILGDFNFELLNDEFIKSAYESMINTKKKGWRGEQIKMNAHIIQAELKELISFLEKNFEIISPSEPTNTWSLTPSVDSIHLKLPKQV